MVYTSSSWNRRTFCMRIKGLHSPCRDGATCDKANGWRVGRLWCLSILLSSLLTISIWWCRLLHSIAIVLCLHVLLLVSSTTLQTSRRRHHITRLGPSCRRPVLRLKRLIRTSWATHVVDGRRRVDSGRLLASDLSSCSKVIGGFQGRVCNRAIKMYLVRMTKVYFVK